jgi:hypothetical protein
MKRKFDALISSALQSASSPATVKKRAHAVHLYKQFAITNGLRRNETIPASEVTLAAFAASLAGSRAGSTIHGIMSALKSWHIQSGADWAGGALLKDVLKGSHSKLGLLASNCSQDVIISPLLLR